MGGNVKNLESDSLKPMALDLETLKAEIKGYLDDSGLAVFHGYRRALDPSTHVHWDTDEHPSFVEFLKAGTKAGAKLFVFHYQAFSLDQIDEALEQLEDSSLSHEEKRNFEGRLHQLQAYEGFTCSLELSFSIDGQIYIYELHTEWYQALNDILAELDAVAEDEEENDGTLGGYFSKN
jgi:hypothetical protein